MSNAHGISERSGTEDKAPPPASEVKQALRQILESHPFRTSKQCQDLLRYIVDHSINGDDASLRERIIGIEVFGRQPTYDTSEDPVVRVRAADVRKRLAQFYQAHEAGTSTLHIELQPGSYRASFHEDRTAQIEAISSTATLDRPAPLSLPVAVEKARAPLSRIRWLQWAMVLVILALLVPYAYRWSQFAWPTPQERFWAPFASTKQPVILYLGTNVGYVFTTDFLDRYRAAHHMPNNGPEFFPDLPPDGMTHNSDLKPIEDTFVTDGDVAATVQLTDVLKGWNRPFVLRCGRDITMADLRNQPSIMIGAFNNPWTLELTKDMPYSFHDGVTIQSRDHPGQSWTIPDAATEPSTTDDYALITRVLTSKTGGPLITVAGVGQYGTQAAAELVGNPAKMADLLKNAPSGWENKNMQAVLHIKVVGYAPVNVEVVATSYW